MLSANDFWYLQSSKEPWDLVGAEKVESNLCKSFTFKLAILIGPLIKGLYKKDPFKKAL